MDSLNPLPNEKKQMSDLFRLKAFADDKINDNETMKFI